MKLAKKVLAIVMALGLIACMSAMAFATTGNYTVNSVTVDNGRTLRVTFIAQYAIGLASGWINMSYNGDLVFRDAETGVQASIADKAKGNSYVDEMNDTQDWRVNYAFYFKENLWDAGTFKEAGVDVDVTNFDLVTFVFDITGPTYSVTLNYNCSDIYGDNDVGTLGPIAAAAPAVTTIKVVSEVPSTTEAEKKDEFGVPVNAGDPTTTEAPTTEAPTTAAADAANAAKTNTGAKTAPKTDGGKNTGDNGVIAVVAGVIALAGAAFVVTKKRK